MERTKPRTVMAKGREFPVLSREEISRHYLDDLPGRLERLITLAGTTWQELAAELGVCAGCVYGRRRERVPGGLGALNPELARGRGSGDGEERPWE